MLFIGLCLVMCNGLLSIYKEISVIGISQKDRCPAHPFEKENNIQYIQTSSNPLDINQIFPILHLGQKYSCIDDAHMNTCTVLHTYTNPTIYRTLQHLKLKNKHYAISKIIIHILTSIFGPFTYALHIYYILPGKNTTISSILYKYLYFLFSICVLCAICGMHIYYSYQTVIYINNCQDLVSTSSNAVSSGSTDVTGLCHILSTCGLTLVSVSINNNIIMYFYTTFLFSFMLFLIIITPLYFIFLCIYDIIIIIANYCDTYRLSILNKRGDELTIALENAPIWFINEYIYVPWSQQYAVPPHENPPLSDRYDISLTSHSLSSTSHFTTLLLLFSLYTTGNLYQLLNALHWILLLLQMSVHYVIILYTLIITIYISILYVYKPVDMHIIKYVY